ncbi:MAG: ferric reductase-like transmembrane domain-containing protein [Chlamydiia bacterium]|nr:ferric reductase-like transmembrane domain-containing protein [Chlamydiia bacterium]
MTISRKTLFKCLLALPAFLFLLVPTLLGKLGPKPWKTLLVHSGYCTIGLLAFVLILTPLSKFLPKLRLKRYRRTTGITVFLYASFHLMCVLIKTIQKKGGLPLDYFFHPVVYTGLGAYMILLLLTVTSNDWSVRTLGYIYWKRLHRFVYVAEGLLFIHIFQKSTLWALVIFIPLVAIQLLGKLRECR